MDKNILFDSAILWMLSNIRASEVDLKCWSIPRVQSRKVDFSQVDWPSIPIHWMHASLSPEWRDQQQFHDKTKSRFKLFQSNPAIFQWLIDYSILFFYDEERHLSFIQLILQLLEKVHFQSRKKFDSSLKWQINVFELWTFPFKSLFFRSSQNYSTSEIEKTRVSKQWIAFLVRKFRFHLLRANIKIKWHIIHFGYW